MLQTARSGIEPPTQANSTGERSLLDLLILFARHRLFIVLTTFICMVIAAIVSLLIPVRYSAESTLLPPQQSSAGAGLLAQLAGGGASAGGGLAALAGGSLSRTQNETYVSMFRSRTVEDAMIKRFNLRDMYHTKTLVDTQKVFESRSKVVAGTKDNIIHVTVYGRTPEESEKMTNAYVEEFQKLVADVAVTEAGQRRKFFDLQLQQAEDNLSNAEQDLKKTELQTGMVQPDSQSRAMIESAASLQGQVAAKEVELQALSSYATDSNPEVVIVKRQIEELRAQLARFTGNSNSVADLFVPKGKVPEAALDYVRKYREVKYRETIFQAIASQYQLARLDEARQGAEFQIIDYAVAPDKKSFPPRTLLTLLAGFLSFIGACGWVWFYSALAERRADPEDGPKLAAFFAALKGKRA